jgi:hypothetical protein
MSIFRFHVTECPFIRGDFTLVSDLHRRGVTDSTSKKFTVTKPWRLTQSCSASQEEEDMICILGSGEKMQGGQGSIYFRFCVTLLCTVPPASSLCVLPRQYLRVS